MRRSEDGKLDPTTSWRVLRGFKAIGDSREERNSASHLRLPMLVNFASGLQQAHDVSFRGRGILERHSIMTVLSVVETT